MLRPVRTTRSAALAATTALTVTLGLAAVGGLSGSAGAAESRAAARGTQATEFALQTSGYGTRARGGDIPVGSSRTAFQVIGCTNLAGIDRGNNLAAVDLPGLGTITGLKTRSWTSKRSGVVAASSRQSIAEVALSDSPLGTLSIQAISTTARALHGEKGFDTSTNTDVGKLVFQPASGPAQTLPLPAPGDPVEIPGFATVTIGHHLEKKGAHFARAWANGLKVQLHATHSLVNINHAYSKISDGITQGVFHGNAAALGGQLLDSVVTVGRNVLSKMPCQGTDGEVVSKAAAGLDLEGALAVGAAHNEQKGTQTARKASGFERSTVASVNLGGQLQIDAITGQANVTRQGRHVTATAKGTTIGAITVNGEPQTFPDTGVLEIPGLAKLEPGVVTKLHGGIQVVGLRITLLDGTGAVIDLASAKLRIEKSGL